MFLRWGHFAYRHRRVIPAVVLLLVLGLYLLWGTRLEDRLSQEGWEDPGADSTLAAQIEEETFGRDSSGDVILLYSAEDTSLLQNQQVLEQINAQLTELREDHPDQISGITSYFGTRNAQLLSEDGRTAFAALSLAGDGEQTLRDFRIIQEDLESLSAPDGISVDIAGATAVADALDQGMSQDISRAEVVALPVVGVLLLLVFGSLGAAVMPLIVGILSIVGSLGVLSLLAGSVQVNVFAQSVVTLLGLGLAIDYGLFMVSRFREEMDKGLSREEAVATTTATAGRTVVFSAAMVAVALSGLMLFPQAFLKSVAYGAISAVGLAAILSVTVLPPIFALIGPRIDFLTVRRTSRTARRLQDTVWWRIPAWAMHHAKVMTVVVAGGLLILALPLGGVRFGGINETYLPPTNDVRATQEQFNELFPNFRTEPVKLVVTDATNAQLVQIYQEANRIEGLAGSGFRPSTATQDGTTVLSAGIENREDNQRILDELRALDVPEGVHVYVGGTPAMEVESIEALLDTLPWMAVYIVAATFILMALVFGSLILPAKAVLMTILGLGATLGVLTALFVDGVGAHLFNFTAGPLMSPVLVLIIAIVYGLSTDYEVFLVSRMVEARDRGENTDSAIRYGTAHTGSIITAAALIMIVVAGAFAFSDIVMMKYIAFGMITALLLDATVIRMMLVPAVMHLLREDNWWAPGWVRRAYEHVGHGRSATAGGRGGAPATAPAEDTRLADVRPVAAGVAERGGRTTHQDSQLVPFRELMDQIEERENRYR